MTPVKATCFDCGTVDLTVADINLTVPTDPKLSSYTFTCPQCAAVVTRNADAKVRALLGTAGVVVLRPPAEATEPHTGRPISYDDLIDLALALQRTDLIVREAL